VSSTGFDLPTAQPSLHDYCASTRASTGQAPIETILPEAWRVPLYRLINDPFRALQERGSVKPKPTMADLRLGKTVAA
jgi:hypothetical protein